MVCVLDIWKKYLGSTIRRSFIVLMLLYYRIASMFILYNNYHVRT